MAAKRKTLAGLEDLRRFVGESPVVSGYTTIEQATIDAFAEMTRDFNWIHVDRERAARESPYGRTIAHGLLTLALTATFYEDVFFFPGQKLSINYGFNKVRFVSAVPSGSRLRGAFRLDGLEDAGDMVRCRFGVELQIEGQSKPAMIAEWLVQMKF
jgi:acyl dehydratase